MFLFTLPVLLHLTYILLCLTYVFLHLTCVLFVSLLWVFYCSVFLSGRLFVDNLSMIQHYCDGRQSKSFVFLHPTSVFSTNPELLRPRHDESAVERPIDMTGQLKAGHELIAYG